MLPVSSLAAESVVSGDAGTFLGGSGGGAADIVSETINTDAEYQIKKKKCIMSVWRWGCDLIFYVKVSPKMKMKRHP